MEEAALCLGISLTCSLEGGPRTAQRSKKLQIQKVVQKPPVVQKPAPTFTSTSGLSILPVKKERVVQEDETLQETSNDEERSNCALCPKSFSSKAHLNRHIATKHTDAVTLSDAVSDTLANIKKNDNWETEGSDAEGQTFACELCGKNFPSLKKLEWHGDQVHVSGKKYKCTKCEKSFLTGLKLNKHMRSHTGSGEHECEVCQKRFPSSSSLILHRNIHLESKPYQCEDCEKGFSQKGNLKVHMEKHHGKELTAVFSESFKNVKLVGEAETMEVEGDLSGENPEEKDEAVIEAMVDEAKTNEVTGEIVSEVLE